MPATRDGKAWRSQFYYDLLQQRMPQQPAELSTPADQHPEHGDT